MRWRQWQGRGPRPGLGTSHENAGPATALPFGSNASADSRTVSPRAPRLTISGVTRHRADRLGHSHRCASVRASSAPPQLRAGAECLSQRDVGLDWSRARLRSGQARAQHPAGANPGLYSNSLIRCSAPVLSYRSSLPIP